MVSNLAALRPKDGQKQMGMGEAGLVQSLPALLLWFQPAFLPQIPEGLSEGLESSA